MLDVYLEVTGFKVYDSISIKNKNKSKCKQKTSRQPRGPFWDGLWGREQVVRLRVIVTLPPQNLVSRQVPRCSRRYGKKGLGQHACSWLKKMAQLCLGG